MTEYVDFRLVVTPDVATPGNWLVAVDDCPLPQLVGPKGSITPTITRADLDALRNRNGWPNVQRLKNIGKAAWDSVVGPNAEAAFIASIPSANGAQKGLRLVVILQGDDPGVAGGQGIRLSEVPVESFFTEAMQFIGTDLQTPISRSFQQKPDRDPERVELPLRVLVAIAAPTDRPQAQTADEKAVIEQAVAGLVGPGNMLEVDYLEQASRQDVAAALKVKPYNVLHFIGHGGFDIVGEVETPRAYLAFVRGGGSTLSDPTDADTLSTMLRNTSVRLVVITACASAAPTAAAPVGADSGPLGTGAFDGIGQRLVTGIAPVNAAVGMQFDLETNGAVEFSRSFYTNLLRPAIPLDEVVTLARQDIATVLQTGHRAWVTPAVYWRCKEGRVFEIEEALGKIDKATLAMIHDLEVGLGINRGNIGKILGKTGAERAALQGFLVDFLTELENGVAERWRLLGETIGIAGGRAAPGATLRTRLVLRMRRAMKIESVRLRVEIPATVATFSSAEAGADSPAVPATAVTADGIEVAVLDPSGGATWTAGEYELGFMNLALVPGAAEALVDIKVTNVEVRRGGGKASKFRGVDGVLFVEGGA